MVEVRETRSTRQLDDLHKYNLYFKIKDKLYNLYTCICCTSVFFRASFEIEEEDTGKTIKNVPTITIQHWHKWFKAKKMSYSLGVIPNIEIIENNQIVLDFLENELKDRGELCNE